MKSCYSHRWTLYSMGEKVLVHSLVWGGEGTNDMGTPEACSALAGTDTLLKLW